MNPLEKMCISLDASLRTVLQAIEDCGREIVFVTNSDGRVVGTLTDGDVRRALLGGMDLDDPIDASIANVQFHSVRVGGNHRAEALENMRAHKIKQVPVLDRSGRLVGLHVIDEFIRRESRPNWAVIMAGGKGTRLRPITETIPKPMVTVAGRPILERLVLGLVGSGISRIFMAVNYKKEMIKEFFGTGAAHACTIEYMEEEVPLGTGGALGSLPENPRDPLLIMNGDLVGDLRFGTLLDHHNAHSHVITIGVGIHQYEVPYGVVEIADGRVTHVAEKPSVTWLVNQGVYVMSPEVLSLVTAGTELPITDLIAGCLARDWSVGVVEMDGEWHDVGRPVDLARARGRDNP